MDIEKAFKLLPTLKKKKNPSAALVLGFLFGSIGLFCYFRKVIDLLLPILAYIALAVFHSQLLGQGGIYVAFGAVVAGVYGYLRAMYSNEELARQQLATGPPLAPAGAGLPGTVPCVSCGAQLDPVAAFCATCGYARAGGSGHRGPATQAPTAAFTQSPVQNAPVQNAGNWWDVKAGGSAVPSAQQPIPPLKKRWWK